MTRFLGTETEYGIVAPSHAALSPIITSTHLVVAFGMAKRCATGARWDFASEHPLRDTRGFDLRRYQSTPVIDPSAIGMANVVLTNGGRFYVDHAHPEYSSPETTNAFDAMLYDCAGDVILSSACAQVAHFSARNHSVLDNHQPCPALKIYKNNVDGKGASYGAHENYFYRKDIDFDAIARGLIPFFVTRQVIIGAGRVGKGVSGQESGFQISQRADYIEQEISLETTLNRGIINTRDEPHTTADRFGRLHVIIGDANMSQIAIFLKLGMTSLVLDAIEAGVDFSDLQLKDAVAEVKNVSYDLGLKHALALADGRSLTALEILWHYHQRVNPQTQVDRSVHQLWAEVLELLAQGPHKAAHMLDWCAKYSLLESFAQRGVSVHSAKAQLIDLQYSDIDPQKSLYHALVHKGRMQQLVSAQDISAAAWTPPQDTRAYFRGTMADTFGSSILAANWDSLSTRCGNQDVRISFPGLADFTAQKTKHYFDSFGQDQLEQLLQALSEDMPNDALEWL
ncbi:depupylase/deamidase Dop [Corynebacterium sp. sy039]|uniref:depupylase/deamidase Dop n=1 Tax=Corynebacterium sp. sy039 TaxID=2599641 RepID=UPI0011B6AE14|nr:depupylase/deamidase Dop [Corynebacterium sp. sy039]QDZ42604.1 proteasome accessory factor PafA2 [Corynebacterium sp. sy039]